MFLPRAIGHRAPSYLPKPRITATRWRTSRFVPTRTYPNKPIQQRKLQSTQPRRHSRRFDGYAYPENLNIFDSGALPFYAISFTRFATLILFGCGTVFALPYTLLDPYTPNYMIPVFAAGSAVPMLLSGLVVGRYVKHINVWLPPSARRSKADLMRFSERVPLNTRIQIKSQWFRPWPHTREMEFRDLRRLPRSRLCLTNLEQQPLWTEKGLADAKRSPMLAWVVKASKGRYHVTRDQVRDKARVSGVWNKMWEQIPMVGEAEAEEQAIGQAMRKGSNVDSTLKRSASKPPPPPKKRKP